MPITILKNLLQVNKNRIRVYKIAYRKTHFKDLRSRCKKYIATSKKNELELLKVIKNLHGSNNQNNTLKGSFFLFVMRFNLWVTNNGRKRILDFCSFWEDKVKKGYHHALSKKGMRKITLPTQKIVTAQQIQIALEQADISLLREESV